MLIPHYNFILCGLNVLKALNNFAHVTCKTLFLLWQHFGEVNRVK